MVIQCEDCGVENTDTEKPVHHYNMVDARLCYDCYHKRRVKLDDRTCDCYICTRDKG